ncbi:hypothetical protein BT93_J0674 [Corymbia citriodora subsp. variegata]|nr:hypothetical protein BT93_J0674 [Corymbia citriodora subsp. variegata]
MLGPTRSPDCSPQKIRSPCSQGLRSCRCTAQKYCGCRIPLSICRVIPVHNEEVLARKYRIRLRGIDAPEGGMPYGNEAKEELAKIIQGKCLRVLVYGEDQYGRSVGDLYCNGLFVQELMLKKGMAWHYTAYDQRAELAKWEKSARAKRIGLWASPNPEEPWEWRKNKREGR